MGNYTYKLNRYFGFTSREIFAIVIGVLLCAFIFTFGKWGYTVDKESSPIIDNKWTYLRATTEDTVTLIDLRYGLKNFFYAIIIAAISILVHNSVQKMVAIANGFKPEHLASRWTMLAGFTLSLLSGGTLSFLAPIKMMMYHLPSQRVGEFKYGLNFWTLGVVGFMGPISSILLAIIFKILLYLSPGNVVLEMGLFFNLWFAASNLLPIPPLDGTHMFFCSRHFYLFSAGALFAIIILLAFVGVLFSLIIGIIIAIILFFFAYLYEGSGGDHH